ncbi:MAG: hypothetical protein A2Y78_08380 [Acidobacteria bacterium RBG_13_68_16]|nr:MAG: hypothetical protein A2Y78_08380 [Acidobacteria bacterium RBG_13_68_16]
MTSVARPFLVVVRHHNANGSTTDLRRDTYRTLAAAKHCARIFVDRGPPPELGVTWNTATVYDRITGATIFTVTQPGLHSKEPTP